MSDLIWSLLLSWIICSATVWPFIDYLLKKGK